MAVPCRTIFQVLEDAAAKFGNAVALHQPVQEGGRRKYQTYTWREYRDAALEIAAGLRSMGIQKGDIVALDSETRAEFYLSDLGIMANGSIAAALYNNYPADDLLRTIRACAANALFAQVPPLSPNDRTGVWLPSAHSGQRVVIELLPIHGGMPVWFAESLLKLPQDIKSVRPTVFLAPPRMWERVYTTVCTEIRKRSAT